MSFIEQQKMAGGPLKQMHQFTEQRLSQDKILQALNTTNVKLDSILIAINKLINLQQVFPMKIDPVKLTDDINASIDTSKD
jgi:hypothetical protein